MGKTLSALVLALSIGAVGCGSNKGKDFTGPFVLPNNFQGLVKIERGGKFYEDNVSFVNSSDNACGGTWVEGKQNWGHYQGINSLSVVRQDGRKIIFNISAYGDDMAHYASNLLHCSNELHDVTISLNGVTKTYLIRTPVGDGVISEASVQAAAYLKAIKEHQVNRGLTLLKE